MAPDPQKNPAEPVSTTIATKNFGNIEIRADQIITFSPGLLGFSEFHLNHVHLSTNTRTEENKSQKLLDGRHRGGGFPEPGRERQKAGAG